MIITFTLLLHYPQIGISTSYYILADTHTLSRLGKSTKRESTPDDAFDSYQKLLKNKKKHSKINQNLNNINAKINQNLAKNSSIAYIIALH